MCLASPCSIMEKVGIVNFPAATTSRSALNVQVGARRGPQY
jgi:hypothetical protein